MTQIVDDTLAEKTTHMGFRNNFTVGNVSAKKIKYISMCRQVIRMVLPSEVVRTNNGVGRLSHVFVFELQNGDGRRWMYNKNRSV